MAAVRSGDIDLAADALQRLAEMTHASATDWALGIEARSRALLSEGERVERLYLEAIERLARTRIRVELARAHLQYGEWLRRKRRRLGAREQLRTAQGMLADMTLEAFASEADRELGARLFISPRTVEYHLHKVFTKLGIRSRNELDRVLPREPSAELRP